MPVLHTVPDTSIGKLGYGFAEVRAGSTLSLCSETSKRPASKRSESGTRSAFPIPLGIFPRSEVAGRIPVDVGALSHALQRTAGIVVGEGACRTSHGLRAFYVSVRRSEGAPDGQIAAEIGDKSVSLIQHTYGSIPPGWQGGAELSFLPKEAMPAWDG